MIDLASNPETVAILSSQLFSLEEIGEQLMDVTITFRTNQNGATHAPGCRFVSKKSLPTDTMTIAAFRQAYPAPGSCRTCGGGTLQALSVLQCEQVDALIPLWKSRLESEREVAEERRLAEQRLKRADAIDQRARDVIRGRDWNLARERKAAAGYPEGVMSAAVPCSECGAAATVSFEPRELKVSFACSVDPSHGFYARDDSDREPLAVWASGEQGYVALALIAPVLAGGDDAWDQVCATRADDYRAVRQALAAFDAENPEPMRLMPDVRCGDCGGSLRYWPAVDFGRGEVERAHYSCDIRHADGRYRNHKKDGIDAAIDQTLQSRLREHPSWATATELEPNPDDVVKYAAQLSAKIEIFETLIGAARADEALAERRTELAERLKVVTSIQEQGAFVTAGLPGHRSSYLFFNPSGTFTEFARALLTTRVEVTSTGIVVVTPFDEDGVLYQSLRIREIQEELEGLRVRRQELETELAALTNEQ